MAFGKRQGWTEGLILIHARQRARCRVLQQTTTSLAFETEITRNLPYQFEILIGSALYPCELKFQKGNRYFVAIEPAREEAAKRPLEDPLRLVEQTDEWTGPVRYFLRH